MLAFRKVESWEPEGVEIEVGVEKTSQNQPERAWHKKKKLVHTKSKRQIDWIEHILSGIQLCGWSWKEEWKDGKPQKA